MKRALQLAPQVHLQQALGAHREFTTLFAKAKERAVVAGWHLAKWLEAHPNTAATELFATIQDELPERTAKRYLEFCRAVLEWVAIEHPNLKGEKALEKGKLLVMQSPKPLTALLREVGQLINPQFEHDATAYQLKKAASQSGQLEFEFGTKTVAMLKALPEIRPETWGRFERGELLGAKAKAEQLLAGINAALGTIDVGGTEE